FEQRGINQTLETKHAGFAKVLATVRRPQKIESRGDGNQRVGRAEIRGVVAQALLLGGVWEIPRRVLVGGDQRAGRDAENRPPFDVALRGMKWRSPDCLLIGCDVSRHAAKWMYVTRLLPQIFLFYRLTARFHLDGRAVPLIRAGRICRWR